MWLVLGWIFVGLGALGALLPLMPTVPFLLVAVFCFERGSPKLHAWILNHPQFGPPVKDWKAHRVIRPRAKLVAAGGLSISLTMTLLSSKPLEVKWIVGVICTAVILFILTRRSRP